jgi:Uma2 family endonuclease
MSTAASTHTADELLRMPGDQRSELVRGELRTMAPAGFDHGAIVDDPRFLLSGHVRQNTLGLMLGAETGFRLASGPDTVRAADVSFIAAARIAAAGRPVGFWPGGPNLAVEVLWPGDAAEEVEEKVDDYLAAGTRLS